MKLIAVLAIVAVIFGNRAKATTPAGESENTNPGKITSVPNANSSTANPPTNATSSPMSTTTNSTTNSSTTPTPTSGNSTTNGTTTPKPITIKPTPPPSPGEFSLKENGSYCILARFVAEFHITFKVDSSGGNLTKTWNQNLGKHSNVTISGNCGSKSESTLVISWPKNESLYSLALKFMNTSRNGWSLSLFTFNVSVDKIPEFANATVKGEVESTYRGSQESRPHGQLGGNYRCNDTVAFAFNNAETYFEVNATFTDFRVQPFANASMEDDFNKDVTECKQDSNPTSTARTPTSKKPPSDVIPIAVGCALAGLVLIVLIAYVIGRRKSHSGYEKV